MVSPRRKLRVQEVVNPTRPEASTKEELAKTRTKMLNLNQHSLQLLDLLLANEVLAFNWDAEKKKKKSR